MFFEFGLRKRSKTTIVKLLAKKPFQLETEVLVDISEINSENMHIENEPDNVGS